MGKQDSQHLCNCIPGVAILILLSWGQNQQSRTRRSNWRGHQTSPTPTVVSLKGRLPQKLQSSSTLSCEINQIHSLFRHGFIKNRNQSLSEIENRRILLLCDGVRKTDLGIDLIAIAFRGSIQNTRLFSILSSFIFCSIIYLFEK